MTKQLLLLFLCGITFVASAKYRPTCNVQTGDTTKVVFNRIAFSIPERAYAADTFFSISCNDQNGLEVINFSSGPRMVIHYFRPSSGAEILYSDQDWCSKNIDGCSVIKYDSVPVKKYGSRYGYYKIFNYTRKVFTLWDAEFGMIYIFRIDSPSNQSWPDPYPKFEEIIKSVIFLQE